MARCPTGLHGPSAHAYAHAQIHAEGDLGPRPDFGIYAQNIVTSNPELYAGTYSKQIMSGKSPVYARAYAQQVVEGKSLEYAHAYARQSAAGRPSPGLAHLRCVQRPEKLIFP